MPSWNHTKGPDGSTTVLSNTIFSTVPGAPVFVGKATRLSLEARETRPRPGHDRAQRVAEHVRVRRVASPSDMRVLRTQNWFVPIMGSLIGTAWIALLLWEQSPYGRYLEPASPPPSAACYRAAICYYRDCFMPGAGC
jgi:hypothetical protein